MITDRKNFSFFKFRTAILFLVSVFIVMPSPTAQAKKSNSCKCCSETAQAAFRASNFAAKDDFWIAVGNAFNLADQDAAAELLDTAKDDLREALSTAKDQKQARLEICEELGEAPYDPIIEPNEFVDFEKVINGQNTFTDNRFFPLTPGTTWEYQTLDESDEVIERGLVEVLDQINEILGVNCIVVRDRVWEIADSQETLIEDTNDFFAQHIDGTVWYFGELAQNFVDGQLDNLEGSWEAGKDFAKPGIIMLADPQAGDFYRQEFALGTAEDVGKVISRGQETVTVPFGTFDDDVLKTEDTSPLEPDVIEFKFYAPETGLVEEIDPDTGERVVLTDMMAT